MARILLIDPSETAQRAMRGLLSRGGHRAAAVETALEAWAFVRANAKVDLIFTELKLPGAIDGAAFIQRLKADRLLKLLPVVVYTDAGDRASVKRCLDLRVQNFLVKPYHEEDVFAEIAKTAANPWRNRLFEEERSFCRMMGHTAEQLHRMLDELRLAVEAAVPRVQKWAALEAHHEIGSILTPLLSQAEAAGAWGMVESLTGLAETVRQGKWGALAEEYESVAFAGQLILHRLDDSLVQPGFPEAAERYSEKEQQEKTRWQEAALAGKFPVIDWAALQREIEGLPGCPVISSSAASFQMIANGHPSCISPLMDLVDRDPALSCQMLIAANQAHPAGENENVIEDPRLAVGLLGERKLEGQARRFALTPERLLDLAGVLNWPGFWLFQTGVGRIAQFTCRYLEFYSMESLAWTAGLLHDLGKLIFLHLHPMGFQTVVDWAQRHRVPLTEAERLFLGCTTGDLAVHFGTRFKLSPHYVNVLRWIDHPEQATADQSLVAIVSLARELCRHNQVGCSGDPVLENPLPLEETPEWRVLSERVFPSFNLRKFELQVHAYCQEMRTQLSSRQGRAGAELSIT